MLIKKKVTGAVTGPSVLLHQNAILVKLNVDNLSGGTQQDLLPVKFTSFIMYGILQAPVFIPACPLAHPQAFVHLALRHLIPGIIVQGFISSGIRSLSQ